VAGLAAAFGSGAMTNSICEIPGAKAILVTGSNTSEGHPIIAIQIKKAVRQNGAKLIVADPRRIDLVDFAAVWLRQRPGTDVALFSAIMNVIIAENLQNKEFIGKRTENFEEFKKVVSKYTPETAEKITGVCASEIVKAARIFATAPTASIIYAMGITQHVTGTDNVKTLANLALLTGNIGRLSTGVNPLRGQNNVQGACDMGALPDFYTGYQKVADSASREKFEQGWGAPLPQKAGLTVVEMMNEAGKGNIKSLYIMGENPLVSDPNLHHVEEALKNLQLLVVQDIFLTETARLAHAVLPAASFAEKDGTFTNTERRVQRVRKALCAPGEVRDDWQIICDISNRLGYSMRYNSPEEIFREITALTPSYAGISYERIEKEGIQWPCADSCHPGTACLHVDRFVRGLGHFHPIEFTPPAETPDKQYPFILTTGRVLYQYHTGTMTRRSKGLNSLSPDAFVEINTKDASRLSIADGSPVLIKSRRGEVKAKASVSEKVPEGVVFIPFHFAESAANILTNDALDPVAKIPELKVCAVNISPEV